MLPSATTGQSEFVYPVPELYLNELHSNIENVVLCLPSNNNTGGLYKQTEMELHIAQAKSHVHHLQELISNKSFHFSELICSGNRPDLRTRAQTAMLQMNGKIAFHAQTYNQVQGRIITLGADNKVLEDYKFLEKMDTKSSTAILDFNRLGSSTNIKLSCIWQTVRTCLGPDLDNPNFVPPTDPGAMLECECGHSISIVQSINHFAVKCVHWLQGRAIYQRCQEEEELVDNEMQWTVQYFLYKSREWADVHWKSVYVGAGPAAFTSCQASQ